MDYPNVSGPSKEGVYTIHLGSSENRIDFEYIQAMHEILEKIETTKGPTACVLAGEGKFFSNGLNIDVLMAQPKELLVSFHRLLSRLLSFPVPLVAAINGHAFAGGAMIAFACDFRVMNRTRGFLCVNEVDIGLPLTPGMCGIVKAKLDRSLWTPTILGAKRWGGEEAVSNRVVDVACETSEVLSQSQSLAARLSSKGATKALYRSLKEEMYSHELRLLTTGLGSAMQSVAEMKSHSKM